MSLGGGGKRHGGQKAWGAKDRGAKGRGAKGMGGKRSGGKRSGGKRPGGKRPGGKRPGGKRPGGKSPRTLKSTKCNEALWNNILKFASGRRNSVFRYSTNPHCYSMNAHFRIHIVIF